MDAYFYLILSREINVLASSVLGTGACNYTVHYSLKLYFCELRIFGYHLDLQTKLL